jgi:UDP-N-acetyl-D-glucosamine dehydrogenase
MNGESYIDDVSDEEIVCALDSGWFIASTRFDDLTDFDFAIITVPTPLRDGAPDSSFIEDAANDLAKNLTEGSTVILESTTYPGSTERLAVPLLERGSGLLIRARNLWSDSHPGWGERGASILCVCIGPNLQG